MAVEMFRINFSWRIEEGSLDKHAETELAPAGELEFAALSDLLRFDQCLILTASENLQPCEMHLDILPVYQLRALSIVAECSAVEVYYGRLKEYNKTYRGTLLYNMEEAKVYRYDIHVPSLTADVYVKFLTRDPHNPLCLYSTRLYMTRTVGPVSLIQPPMAPYGSRINPLAVQQLLHGTVLSERAEKCKQMILSSMLSAQMNVVNNNAGVTSAAAASTFVPTGGDTVAPASILASSGTATPDDTAATAGDTTTASTPQSSATIYPSNDIHKLIEDSRTSDEPDQNISRNLENKIKLYIDKKFAEFEQCVDKRLMAMETRQNEKLDLVLKLLQQQKVSCESVD